MASNADRVPAVEDLLCENCGYILNGLNSEGKCPECGNAIGPSTSGTPRRLSVWEEGEGSRVGRFLRTTGVIIFRPRWFYRNLTTRTDSSAARQFARIHWGLAAGMLALAAWMHANWYERDMVRAEPLSMGMSIGFLVLLGVGAYFGIQLTTRLAAKLTAWEGAYRGYRLPYAVVLRALYFHAAHFLPVALVAVITVGGYRAWMALGAIGGVYYSQTSAPAYLYVLCGEVIVAAVYLFNTYWIGMRNLMYANR